MGGKNSAQIYNALGKSDLLSFDPDQLEIVTDPTHPLYDERANNEPDESMILSIMAQGVIQPIRVSRDKETGAVYVVVGRQRVKALRIANQRLKKQGEPQRFIKAEVVKANPAELACMIVAENEIRRGDSAMVRAQKMSRLQTMHGLSDDQLGIVFGVSKATIKNTLALLTCTTAVQKAVDSGAITVKAARDLASLDPPEQREAVQKMTEAAAGKFGHDKTRAVRKATPNAEPAMRGRKQIKAAMENTSGEAWMALAWVLGDDSITLPGPIVAKAA